MLRLRALGPSVASALSAAACRQPPVRFASIPANEVREGGLLEMEGGQLWRVVLRNFSRTAAGRAYVQMELRHLTEGTKRDLRFRSEDLVEEAALDSPARYTVLYSSGDMLTLMHATTFEQTELPASLLGDGIRYLHDGLLLTIESYQGVPAIVSVPSRVSVRVTELDASGGDSATVVAVSADDAGGGGSGGGGSGASFKCRVPKFIKVGDVLVVDTTANGKYHSRASSG